MHLSVKKASIILIVILVVGSIIILVAAQKRSNVVYATTKAVKGKILQTVSETGTVRAVNELNLNFLNPGKIARIHQGIGDQAKAGDVLAELDYSSLDIRLLEARANLDINQQNLNKLLAGATSEEIEISKASLNQARASFDAAEKDLEKTRDSMEISIAQAQKNYDDLVRDNSSDLTVPEQAVITAQTNLNNTITTYQKTIEDSQDTALNTVEDKIAVAKNALDIHYTVLNDDDGKDYIGVKNMTFKEDAEKQYNSALALHATTMTSHNSAAFSATEQRVLSVLDDALGLLNTTFDALVNCFGALENSITTSAYTQTELDAAKTSINTQQNLVAAAILSVQTSKQGLDNAALTYDTKVSQARDSLAQAQATYDNAVLSAKNALDSAKASGDQQTVAAESRVNTAREAWQLAQAQLNKIMADPNVHDRALANARVRQAQATIDNINKQIEDSKIFAPIDGTVTKLNYEIGEQVMAGTMPVMSLLGESDFEIEVLISEADIAKVSEGDEVDITFDAFGDDRILFGSISFIEPAETVIQDVIYYQVDIGFDPKDYEIKSGMTTNVTITTNEKDNVIMVPSRAVIDRNGEGKFVRVLNSNEIAEVPVEVGLRGDEGMIEIVSGVQDMQEIVTSVKDK